MAITNAQQYKQLVNPPMEGKKRPGYRGVGGYRGGPGGSGGGKGKEAPGSKGSGFEGGQNVGRDSDIKGAQRMYEARQIAKNLAEDKAFEQQGFETLRIKDSNFPGFIGMGLNALKGPRQKLLDRNIDFFRNDPRTRKAREKYGLTAQGYKDYMSARLAGTIDAAGNPIMTGDDDDNVILPVDTTFNMAPSNMDQEPEVEDPFVLARRFRADGGIMNANVVGGEMDFESARQMYGLGKLVKKATRTVKKIAKSPIGKAALLYAGAGGLGNLAAGKGFGSMFSNFLSPTKFLSTVPGIFTKAGLQNIGARIGLGSFENIGGERIFEANKLGSFLSSPMGLITGASAVAGLLTPEEENEAQQLVDNTGIDIEAARNSILAARREQYAMDSRARGFKADGGLMRQNYDEAGAVMSKEDMKKLAKSPLYKGFKMMYGVSPDMAKDNEKYKGKFEQFEQLFKKGYQKGGDVEPVAKKTMPLLDMGGKEMDLREDGGFVPIGRMEKADDVPARLSKNEFVFTADAVRNAGDGDVDKGAEVMYNMMKNLEAGGDVSEESQGLEGARKMFQTSQRLEEVL